MSERVGKKQRMISGRAHCRHDSRKNVHVKRKGKGKLASERTAFSAFSSLKIRFAVCVKMHHIKMVKSMMKTRERMGTLTYGWRGWDVIYGTDAFGINFPSDA